MLIGTSLYCSLGNLFPRQSFGSASIHISNHAHHSRHHSTGSLDSMVLLQITEDDKHLLVTEKDSGDYDHLLPKEDFSHLCSCTYGLMGEQGDDVGGSRGRGLSLSLNDDHTANIH